MPKNRTTQEKLNFPVIASRHSMPPPRLSMEDYCEFVQLTLDTLTSEQIDRQHRLKKQNIARFFAVD